eukprot:753374-Hanusia_phi.AAC.15
MKPGEYNPNFQNSNSYYSPIHGGMNWNEVPMRASHSDSFGYPNEIHDHQMIRSSAPPLFVVNQEMLQDEVDSVTRLQNLLSAATKELGRQISTSKVDVSLSQNDTRRADWLQKIVLQELEHLNVKFARSNTELQDKVSILVQQLEEQAAQFEKQKYIMMQQRDSLQLSMQKELENMHKELLDWKAQAETRKESIAMELKQTSHDNSTLSSDLRRLEALYKESQNKLARAELQISQMMIYEKENQNLIQRHVKKDVTISKCSTKVQRASQSLALFKILKGWRRTAEDNKFNLHAFSSWIKHKHVSTCLQDWQFFTRSSIKQISDFQQTAGIKKELFMEKDKQCRITVRVRQGTEALEKELGYVCHELLAITESLERSGELLESNEQRLSQQGDRLKDEYEEKFKSIEESHREETARLQRFIENSKKQFQEELQAALKNSSELEAKLRQEFVEESTQKEKQLQDLKDELAKMQREWRKKLLDKDREHALQIETVERQKIEAEEEHYQKVRAKDKEWENEVEKVRLQSLEVENDLRQRLQAREKDLSNKIEMIRQELSNAHREFEADLQAKESEMQSKLAEKDKYYEAWLDSMVANKMKESLADMEAQMQNKEDQLVAIQQELEDQKRMVQEFAMSRESHRQEHSRQVERLEDEIRDLTRALDRLQSKAEEMQAWRKDEASLEASISSLQQQNARLEKQLEMHASELKILEMQKESLTNEILRKGDLQQKASSSQEAENMEVRAKLEMREQEIIYIKDKLAVASATNERLTTDLLDASKLLKQYSSDAQHQPWETSHQDQAYEKQREVDAPRRTLRSVDTTEIQKRVESLTRENDTLTSEMDKILQENSMLRAETEDLKQQIEDFAIGCSNWTSRTRAASRSYGMYPRRLVERFFVCWLNEMLAGRVSGRKSYFSNLTPMIDNNGCLTLDVAATRLRKQDVEIKPDKIGSGTFADVFKGELRIQCAVKRPKSLSSHQEVMEFIREGEMMRAMEHPYITKTLGILCDQGISAYVMELLPGCNLFDYLHKHNQMIPLGKQVDVAVQVCDAMMFVHELRIIHRDLKPQNVIYNDKTGAAKLCDFGLARSLPNGVSHLDPIQLGTGGTPAYQAPEASSHLPSCSSADPGSRC